MQTHFEDYFARVVKKEHGRVYVYGYCNNLNRTRFREEDGRSVLEEAFDYLGFRCSVLLEVKSGNVNDLFRAEKNPMIHVLGKPAHFGILFSINRNAFPGTVRYENELVRCILTMEGTLHRLSFSDESWQIKQSAV